MLRGLERAEEKELKKATASSIVKSLSSTELKVLKDGGIEGARIGGANGLASTSVNVQAWGGFKSFLEELKGFAGITAKGGAADAERLLKSVETEIKSVDDALKSVPVTKSEEGFLKIGDETVGSIHKTLREGDLEGLLRAAKRPDIPITARDSAAYKTLVGETPERAVKDIDDAAVVNKRNLPQLDSTVENLDKMSTSAKNDLKKVENNLMKKFKQGTVIALTVGAVVVGVDWVSKATEARKGCFMLTMLNNKTSSCKLQAYTCVGNTDGAMCSGAVPDAYNTTLLMIKIASMSDNDANKIALAEAAQVSPAELNDKLGECIDKHYESMAVAIRDSASKPAVEPCALSHPQVEKGIIPPCRMCSPSASPVSTQFIDPNMYGENITFQCVTNPSILDTITDVIASTGENILSGIGGFISGTLKPFLIVGIVILVLVLLIVAISKFGGKKPNADNVVTTTSSSSSTTRRPPPPPPPLPNSFNNGTNGAINDSLSSNVYGRTFN